MRKYYSKDFNTSTLYSQKKRRRKEQFYFACISSYIQQKFPSLSFEIKTDPNTNKIIPAVNLDDLVFFFGSFIYPKDIEASMADLLKEDQGASKQNLERMKKFLHSHFYSFSVGKLMKLVLYKYFAFFFCHYFDQEIARGNRIEQNSTMNKNLFAYKDGCNLILTLS